MKSPRNAWRLLWIARFFLRNKNRLETSPLGGWFALELYGILPAFLRKIGASPQSVTPAIVVSYFSAEIVSWSILGST
jgi:hypothetical protein